MSTKKQTAKSSPGKIKIGIQPTGWTNDDFPEIGNDTPYQKILNETRDAGYKGGSTGHNYPSHLPSLEFDLKSRGLGITSTWVGTHFTAEDCYDLTIETVREQIAFLKSVNATDIVVAELANAVNQIRTKSVLTDRPIFNEAQKYLLYRGLDEAGKMAAAEGMRLSYHPHVGTGVQQIEETRELLARTNKDYVWLCLDTGHTQLAGDDPHVLAREQARRIGHVHLKNVRQEIVEKARREKYSFYEAILEGVFTVPGDVKGAIDFEPIFEALISADFQGWIVVEAEQDPTKHKSPREFAEIARKFVKKNLGV